MRPGVLPKPGQASGEQPALRSRVRQASESLAIPRPPTTKCPLARAMGLETQGVLTLPPQETQETQEPRPFSLWTQVSFEGV